MPPPASTGWPVHAWLAGDAGDIIPAPVIAGRAPPGGLLAQDVVDHFEAELVDGLERARPFDGVLMLLHGACAAERIDDVDGRLLSRARDIAGSHVPIVVSLDHHANITQRTVDAVDGLVGHRTQPHDLPDAARAAAKLLFATVRGEITPTIAWHKIPMISHQEQFRWLRAPRPLHGPDELPDWKASA